MTAIENLDHRNWLIGLMVERQDDYVVVECAGDYYRTSRWEINPDNGYVTAQLKDGSILPTRFGSWAPASLALDVLGVLPQDIKPDVEPE